MYIQLVSTKSYELWGIVIYQWRRKEMAKVNIYYTFRSFKYIPYYFGLRKYSLQPFQQQYCDHSLCCLVSRENKN